MEKNERVVSNSAKITTRKLSLTASYCLGFEDDGCPPRDSFIPKQESDKKKLAYPASQPQSKCLHQVVFCRGALGGNWSRYSLRIQHFNVGQGFYQAAIYRNDNYEKNFKPGPPPHQRKIRTVESAIKACLPRRHMRHA